MLSASCSATIAADSSLLRRAGSVAYLAVLRAKFVAAFVAAAAVEVTAVVAVVVEGVSVADFSLSFRVALFGCVLKKSNVHEFEIKTKKLRFF